MLLLVEDEGETLPAIVRETRVTIGVCVEQVSHNSSIGSLTHTSPWCLLAASMYLLPAGFAEFMVFLSSGVSFFLLLEGILTVVASIILNV